jgi:hypothetical protein
MSSVVRGDTGQGQAVNEMNCACEARVHDAASIHPRCGLPAPRNPRSAGQTPPSRLSCQRSVRATCLGDGYRSVPGSTGCQEW